MHGVKSLQINEEASFIPQRDKIPKARTSFLVLRGNCSELVYELKGTWKKYAFRYISTDIPSIDSCKQERCIIEIGEKRGRGLF
jgi:hypothetical protein